MKALDEIQVDDYHKEGLDWTADQLRALIDDVLLPSADADAIERAKHLSDLRDARLELEQVRRLLQPAGGDHAPR